MSAPRRLGSVPGLVRITDDVPAAFAETVLAAFAGRPDPDSRFTLVLSGGPTARACYRELAQRTTPGPSGPVGIDWSRVDVLLGDERCVDGDDPDANQRLVREALLEPVGAWADRPGNGARRPTPGTGLRFLPMSCEDPAGYGRLLARYPALDVVHLGLGPDGHTASLFPGSNALVAPPGALVLVDVDPAGRNPHRRMTLTLEALGRARLAVFTVVGDAKRRAFSAVAAGADLPAARVRAQRILWLVDRAAAAGAA